MCHKKCPRWHKGTRAGRAQQMSDPSFDQASMDTIPSSNIMTKVFTGCCHLGNAASRCCQDHTGRHDIYNLSSRAAKGLELSQGGLVQAIQGGFCLLNNRLCGLQVMGTLCLEVGDLSLRISRRNN